MKSLIVFCIAVCISFSSYCQTANASKDQKDTTRTIFNPKKVQHNTDNTLSTQPLPFYRDTRLGSSSPQYNTYKKNDDGAGAITTNPNKWGSGSTELSQVQFTPSTDGKAVNSQPTYRDTRLGSSSPMYNTYRKNDNGAGAITTNPNKWGSGAPVIISNPEASQDTTTSHIAKIPERTMTKRDK